MAFKNQSSSSIYPSIMLKGEVFWNVVSAVLLGGVALVGNTPN
jgi:hypothetical protein